MKVRLCQGCPLSLILFITFMDRIPGHSQGVEGFLFGGVRISFLLYADDMVLLAPWSGDIQLVLEQFAAECEAEGMRALPNMRPWSSVRKGQNAFAGLGVRFCLKWMSLSISGSCLRLVKEWSNHWRADRCSVKGDAYSVPVCCGIERAEPKGNGLCLPVDHCSNPHL